MAASHSDHRIRYQTNRRRHLRRQLDEAGPVLQAFEIARANRASTLRAVMPGSTSPDSWQSGCSPRTAQEARVRGVRSIAADSPDFWVAAPSGGRHTLDLAYFGQIASAIPTNPSAAARAAEAAGSRPARRHRGAGHERRRGPGLEDPDALSARTAAAGTACRPAALATLPPSDLVREYDARRRPLLRRCRRRPCRSRRCRRLDHGAGVDTITVELWR
jgi:hypothetical protein